MAFWLGIGELAVSTAKQYQGALSLKQQYNIGFWTGVGLAGVALLLTATIKLGKASAALTADEKEAKLEMELAEATKTNAATEGTNFTT